MVELPLEERPAGEAFLREGPVVRGGATERCRDERVVELEAVVARCRLKLRGEPEPMKRSIEPLSGAISGEHPARSVGTVRRRSEADDQQTRLWISKTRHRTAPVLLVFVCRSLFACDLLAPQYQPWAYAAQGDFGFEFGEADQLRVRIYQWSNSSSPSLIRQDWPSGGQESTAHDIEVILPRFAGRGRSHACSSLLVCK